MKKEKAAGGPRLWLALAGTVFAAGLAVHLPFLSGELLWDDEHYLAANGFAADCANLGQAVNPLNLVKVLPVPMSARPVVNASLILDACSGAGPRGMKVTNALLHAFNGVLAFFAVLALSGAPLPSLLGALAFALHPAAAETIHIVTFRSHLLGFFFFTCGMLAVIFHARKPSAAKGIAAAGAYLLAVLSVETAAVLPLAAALAVHYDSGRPGLRRCAPLLAAAVLIAAFFLWFRAPRSGYTIPGSSPGVAAPSVLYPAAIFPSEFAPPSEWKYPPQWSEVYASPAANAYTMASVTLENLRRLALPYDLSADYAPAVKTLASRGLPLIALCLAAAGFGIKLFSAGRLPGLGMLVVFAGLLPAMNIWPVYNLQADRYLYLPALGLAILAAGVLKSSLKRPGGMGALALSGAVFWTGWLGMLNHGRGPQFKDNLALFTSALQISPHSARAWASAGAAYLRAGDCGHAAAHFDSAAASYPESDILRLRAASALAWCGFNRGAERHLRALPESPDTIYVRGLLALRSRKEKAAEYFAEALRQAPARRDFHLALLLAQERSPASLEAEDRADLQKLAKAWESASWRHRMSRGAAAATSSGRN